MVKASGLMATMLALMLVVSSAASVLALPGSLDFGDRPSVIFEQAQAHIDALPCMPGTQERIRVR